MSVLLDEAGKPIRRRGRGRLSSIEALPENCDEDIAWAKIALTERKMPQTEILREFNARLADKGVYAGISKGAFSRWSVRTAIELRKMSAARDVANAVLERMPQGERSDATLAAIELVKFRLLELIMDEEQADPKTLAATALALQRLSRTAILETEGQRRQRDDDRSEDQRKRLADAAEAANKAGKQAGVGPETLRRITHLLTTGAA